MISLQKRRFIERFIELADFPCITPADSMELNLLPLRLSLVWHEAHLAVMLTVTKLVGNERLLLPELLATCQPEHTFGIPCRAFVLPGVLGIAANVPVEAGPETAYALYRWQYQWLRHYCD